MRRLPIIVLLLLQLQLAVAPAAVADSFNGGRDIAMVSFAVLDVVLLGVVIWQAVKPKPLPKPPVPASKPSSPQISPQIPPQTFEQTSAEDAEPRSLPAHNRSLNPHAGAVNALFPAISGTPSIEVSEDVSEASDAPEASAKLALATSAGAP